MGQTLLEVNPNLVGASPEKKLIALNTKHGLRGHPLYIVYNNMKSRCYNLNNKSYLIYGGRGIIVCQEWYDDFTKFYLDVIDGYEEGLELDRIDSDGNYEASNCRWVTSQQNCFNTRSKGGSSKYKGVSWHKATEKWMAQIRYNGVNKYLGVYNSEDEAAEVYNREAIKYFGEYAYLNKIK